VTAGPVVVVAHQVPVVGALLDGCLASNGTVRSHGSSIMRKVGAVSRGEAIKALDDVVHGEGGIPGPRSPHWPGTRRAG
jgi:hypothetical protein